MKKGPFKMKGYTYPGTSPVKHEGFGAHVHKRGGSGSYDKKTGKQTGIDNDSSDTDADDTSDDGIAGQVVGAIIKKVTEKREPKPAIITGEQIRIM
tara:strand:+ start:936 stop:1223 length:288 start_codon:yes stop_codon:yes gene_type:complete